MIHFNAENAKVIVQIDTRTPVEKSFYNIYLHAGDNIQAHVLAEHLQNKFEEAVAKARLESYDAGWADAKAKRRKREKIYNVRI